MTDPFPADHRAGMIITELLRDADITPTTDAVRAFRLGYGRGRADLINDRGLFARIIDRATTHVKP